VGDEFEMHEFLYVPKCDCNLLGRDLMAKLGMQIDVAKGQSESNTVVTVHKFSEEAYAEVDPMVWATPGNYGKWETEPLQITLKQPEEIVSIKKSILSPKKEGRKCERERSKYDANMEIVGGSKRIR